MIRFGYLFFGSIVVAAILLSVPLPFSVPRSFQTFFGSGYGELVFLSIWLFLFGSILILFLKVVIDRIVDRRWNVSHLYLTGYVTGATLILIFCVLVTPSMFGVPFERIYLGNRNRAPNEFSNRYLRFKTVDCRDISKEYGIVFISKGISIETDFLSYAPERTDKTTSCLICRKFGDDWYWDKTGSQWDRDLFNCVERNKAPGE